MSSSIITSSITCLATGERTVEVVTDGRVGAEAEAFERAGELFSADPFLSFRKNDSGELRFYFTDRLI